MSHDYTGPTYQELLWPTLQALKQLGGSGNNREIVDKIIEMKSYPAEILNYRISSAQTKLEYNASWARSFLKKVSAINNSQRGVWVILEEGEKLTLQDMADIPARVQKMVLEEKEKAKGKKVKPNGKSSDLEKNSSEENLPENEDEESWRSQLISRLLELSPADFERLAQLILRESGFVRVEVTGKSGDGGIDGTGILRVNLISFHVAFQCKRYKSSVGAPAIRDFRGAIMGRSDKGIIITTGNFTTDARAEATRDGALAVDLIDGTDLCDLMKKLGIGLKVSLIESVQIDKTWFKKF